MIVESTETFQKIYEAVDFNSTEKQIICNEGSSRSGKTYGTIDVLLLYSQKNKNKNKKIRIFRNERATCMVSVFVDFIDRLKAIDQFDSTKLRLSTPTTYTHFGNQFIFMGLDDAAKLHGIKQNVAYFNESLECSLDAFRQVNQRTSELFFLDWNPKCTDHWCFDLEKRDDTKFIHTTFLNNGLLDKSIVKELRAYEPTPYNIEKGTADDFMWKVYGLGLRASPEGVVFNNVTWIDSFPDDIEKISYGLDFGYTNDPTALVKCGVNGINLYLEKLIYTPYEDAESLYPILESYIKDSVCWADSADPGMISDLRRKGLNVFGARKFNGSKKYGIDLMKRFKIHLVRSPEFRKEQENYKWRVLDGRQLNETVEKFDHLWDAARYNALHELRNIFD